MSISPYAQKTSNLSVPVGVTELARTVSSNEGGTSSGLFYRVGRYATFQAATLSNGEYYTIPTGFAPANLTTAKIVDDANVALGTTSIVINTAGADVSLLYLVA